MKSVLIVVLILLIGAVLFLPKEMDISRSIEIDAPKDIVFHHASDLKKFDKWSYWNSLDPDMKIEWGEITEGIGAKFSWESEMQEVGKGEMTIIEHEPMKYIKTKMLFGGSLEPFFAELFFEDGSEGKSRVKWTMNVQHGNFDLIGRTMTLFLEGMIAEAYQNGLNKMKEITENLELPEYSVDIKKGTYDNMLILAIKDTTTCDMNKIQEDYTNYMNQLFDHFQKNKIDFTGMPMTIQHTWDPENNIYIYEIALPVTEERHPETEEIYLRRIVGGEAIIAEQMGSYDQLSRTYRQLEWYMQENAIKIKGPPIEMYMNNPSEVDFSELKTRVYYPI